jgi:prevent-host-death family protein
MKIMQAIHRVGIRELRINAGAVVRRAQAGQPVEITDRGRPVARLVPLTYPTILDRLVAEGSAWPATEDPALLWQYEAPPAQPDEPTVAEVLRELRRERT